MLSKVISSTTIFFFEKIYIIRERVLTFWLELILFDIQIN